MAFFLSVKRSVLCNNDVKLNDTEALLPEFMMTHRELQQHLLCPTVNGPVMVHVAAQS